jgi:putative ABC transport system permease protein
MDPEVQYVDEIRPLNEIELQRVRSVTGVAWATPLFKGLVRARTEDGRFRQAILLGVDDASLAGAPQKMLLGSAADLWKPDAVIVDKSGHSYLWPGERQRIGRVLEIGESRANLVGICNASPPFQTLPIMYTRYSLVSRFAPPERRKLSFVLVGVRPDVSAEEVCRRIEAETGLMALTGRQFIWKTIEYYFRSTGIPLNFGIVVSLGFVVGIAVAGQTFYLFTIENLKQFGLLKAVGVRNRELIGMILLQALVVSTIGFALGIGGAALLLKILSERIEHLAGFFLPWQVVAFSGTAVFAIMIVSSLLSIRRALVLEPAIVFRG